MITKLKKRREKKFPKRLQKDRDYQRFKGGYRVIKVQAIKTSFRGFEITSEYFDLYIDGTLIIKVGYWWDGATCAIDSPSFMRGSLIHDCLYQALRELLFFTYRRHSSAAHDTLRLRADEALIAICKEDGMWWIRRKWVNRGVRLGGVKAAEPDIINYCLDLSKRLPA